ncbi:uncharacterized protein Bfra_010183 [Botrytis fragariae]|uniref:Heterokaryon incompatibility domain-containing protein n=1 Tax=Botrytis fragariae TaxID=1964551 RepID=A0A8H6ALZ8_9HELO|nr:uncharacterized protein Bfra_010183 [Botrytis fragariae]KAF5870037.1 hypothetical protein Bfra_010183 [Botrytis fragariae]
MNPPLLSRNRDSNTATEAPLCAICSAQLTLDEANSGGALKNEDGVSVLYFPHADSLRSSEDWSVTLPNLPELSDSFACKFCLALKRSLLDRYGDYLWWKEPSPPLKIEGRYQWYSPPETRRTDKGPHFRLSALAITYSHPEMENTYGQKVPDKFPVMAEPGHWQDERFHGSLQWTIVPEIKASFRNMIKGLHDPEKYCAPSWSWASRNQGRLIMLPIGTELNGTEADFEFVSNNLVAAKSNVRVRTRPGSSITLRGRVRPFAYPPTESTKRYDRLGYIPRSAEWEVSVPGGRIYHYLGWNPLLDDTSWEELRPSLRLFLLTNVGMGLVLLSELKYEPGFRRVGVFLFVSSNKCMNGANWFPHYFMSDNLRFDFLQTGWNVEDVVLY